MIYLAGVAALVVLSSPHPPPRAERRQPASRGQSHKPKDLIFMRVVSADMSGIERTRVRTKLTNWQSYGEVSQRNQGGALALVAPTAIML